MSCLQILLISHIVIAPWVNECIVAIRERKSLPLPFQRGVRCQGSRWIQWVNLVFEFSFQQHEVSSVDRYQDHNPPTQDQKLYLKEGKFITFGYICKGLRIVHRTCQYKVLTISILCDLVWVDVYSDGYFFYEPMLCMLTLVFPTKR